MQEPNIESYIATKEIYLVASEKQIKYRKTKQTLDIQELRRLHFCNKYTEEVSVCVCTILEKNQIHTWIHL